MATPELGTEGRTGQHTLTPATFTPAAPGKEAPPCAAEAGREQNQIWEHHQQVTSAGHKEGAKSRPASRWGGTPLTHVEPARLGGGGDSSSPAPAPPPAPSPEVVMNCRDTALRGVRTISIKHNFLMKRLRGSPVQLIRIECSLQPLGGREEGAGGLVLASTWAKPGWAAGVQSWLAPGT